MGKIEIEKDGPITIITLNRPEVRNAVDPETADLLREAFTAFDADDDAHVGVLAGTGPTFCAGFDLKALAEEAGLGEKYEPEGIGPLGISRFTISKPVIAAVQGYSVAGGLELALWCDMRVAEESATFGVFCRRWGVPLIDGGTIRLPRLIGQGHAMDMILTGRPVGAAEALSWGLANRVVPDGEARNAAVELAKEIARFPQLCMKADRISAITQWGYPLEEALHREGRGGAAVIEAESVGGAARFAAGAGRSGDFADI
ncbi:MAG: enoyl-CoA hydratase [Pseudonocardia sp. SCN 72-86]|nr:MAG: enoyl-CoA hydratase [Pseudonocardia sp. SCN 72-86]